MLTAELIRQATAPYVRRLHLIEWGLITQFLVGIGYFIAALAFGEPYMS